MDYKAELASFCEHQLKKNVAPLPLAISLLLEDANRIKVILHSDCDQLLLSEEIQDQIGYSILPNRGWYVAMVSPMPHVTIEMIDWWFWWHAQENIRYQMWFPHSHRSISYARRDEPYFNQPFNGFKPNTQFPDEIIGSMKGKLTIAFVHPSDFGFTAKAITESKVARIVCGHVGLYFPKIQHTEMCHLFFKTEDGLKIVSRFWLGNKIAMQPSFMNKIIESPLIKSKLFYADRAKEMAEHCCIEYRNLATFLPELYYKFAHEGQLKE